MPWGGAAFDIVFLSTVREADSCRVRTADRFSRKSNHGPRCGPYWRLTLVLARLDFHPAARANRTAAKILPSDVSRGWQTTVAPGGNSHFSPNGPGSRFGGILYVSLASFSACTGL